MHLNNKIEGLTCLIAFSKSFLSFSKDKKEAKKYLEYTNKFYQKYYTKQTCY